METINKQDILDGIKYTAMLVDIDGYSEDSEQPDVIIFHYKVKGMGAILAGKISDYMHENHPKQDYELRIKHGDFQVEVSLM
jgi:hypothetical protein